MQSIRRSAAKMILKNLPAQLNVKMVSIINVSCCVLPIFLSHTFCDDFYFLTNICNGYYSRFELNDKYIFCSILFHLRMRRKNAKMSNEIYQSTAREVTKKVHFYR